MEVIETDSKLFTLLLLFRHSVMSVCSPVDCSTPGFPVHHQLLERAQTHVRRVGDAIPPSCPLCVVNLLIMWLGKRNQSQRTIVSNGIVRNWEKVFYAVKRGTESSDYNNTHSFGGLLGFLTLPALSLPSCDTFFLYFSRSQFPHL